LKKPEVLKKKEYEALSAADLQTKYDEAEAYGTILKKLLKNTEKYIKATPKIRVNLESKMDKCYQAMAGRYLYTPIPDHPLVFNFKDCSISPLLGIKRNLQELHYRNDVRKLKIDNKANKTTSKIFKTFKDGKFSFKIRDFVYDLVALAYTPCIFAPIPAAAPAAAVAPAAAPAPAAAAPVKVSYATTSNILTLADLHDIEARFAATINNPMYANIITEATGIITRVNPGMAAQEVANQLLYVKAAISLSALGIHKSKNPASTVSSSKYSKNEKKYRKISKDLSIRNFYFSAAQLFRSKLNKNSKKYKNYVAKLKKLIKKSSTTTKKTVAPATAAQVPAKKNNTILYVVIGISIIAFIGVAVFFFTKSG